MPELLLGERLGEDRIDRDGIERAGALRERDGLGRLDGQPSLVGVAVAEPDREERDAGSTSSQRNHPAARPFAPSATVCAMSPPRGSTTNVAATCDRTTAAVSSPAARGLSGIVERKTSEAAQANRPSLNMP